MEKLEVIFEFMKKLVIGLAVEGVLLIIVGALIFVYPDLLGILVGIILIVTGVVALIYSFKLKKYTKLTIKI